MILPPGISCFQSFRLRSVNWPKCRAGTFVSKVPAHFGERICTVHVQEDGIDMVGLGQGSQFGFDA